MNTKKTALVFGLTLVLTLTLTYVNYVNAAYDLLVAIPGIPSTGVTMSMYLIGLYNFLLSIVGIVAVMMLIIGGMRYITAIGNASAISDAKDIIQNAIVGLIIALLSWVFVSTVNPDALYIKGPDDAFIATEQTDLSICYTDYDPAITPNGECTCVDGTTVTATTGVGSCHSDCEDYCNSSAKHPCIALRSITSTYSEDFDGECTCLDGHIIEAPTDPQQSCSDLCAGQDHCGFRFLRIKLDPKGSWDPTEGVFRSNSDTEVWEFHLTNDGEIDVFDIQPNVTSYTDTIANTGTYHCATLETNENALNGDYSFVHWVKKGVIINGEYGSPIKDIESYGANSSIACPYKNDACRMNSPIATYDIEDPKNHRGVILYTTYINGTENKCGNCSIEEKNGNSFFPADAFKCVEDPRNNLRGTWIKI